MPRALCAGKPGWADGMLQFQPPRRLGHGYRDGYLARFTAFEVRCGDVTGKCRVESLIGDQQQCCGRPAHQGH